MIATARLFYLLWIWTLVGLLAGFIGMFVSIWVAFSILIVGASLFDIMFLSRKPDIRWTRHVEGSLSVGSWNEVTLEVHNHSGRKLRLEVFDHHPLSVITSNVPAKCEVPAVGWSKLVYQLLPLERGQFNFKQIQTRIAGWFGLFQRNCYYPLISEVKVLPNFANIVKYSLLAQDQRQSQMGIRKVRRRGEGMEFQQLREYRIGDTLKKVDWKATSRMHKLISREYQDEKDQRIIFLVDCGRKMNAVDGDLSHFDHTLNALLLVSYIALRQGDSIGLMTFGGEDRWLAPNKGVHMVNKVLNSVYDLKPSLTEPDYLNCATRISRLFPKRSLVVLITNLRDEESDELLPTLRLLKRRNLVLLASMRERVLDDTLEKTVLGFTDALENAATQQFMEHRKAVYDQIKQLGVLMVDVPPEQLAISMANKYFQIKSSGLL